MITPCTSSLVEQASRTSLFVSYHAGDSRLIDKSQVAQKPFQILGHIFAKPKDPVTKEQRTDAIYSIPCNDCDNEYIGQTKRQFGTRLKEHQKAVFFCKKENSALSEHACLTNQTIGWDKSKFITTNRRYHQRLCLEAWPINSVVSKRWVYEL